MSFIGSSENLINFKFDNQIELANGQMFFWNSFTSVSNQEIDSRISLLSQNIPKIIKNNKSTQDKIGEMAWISPLWSTIEITPEIDKQNRSTIFFFEVVAKKCKPLRLFLNKKEEFNRYELEPVKADLLAREMRFFIRRIANLSKSERMESSYRETLDDVVELDFDGYHLEFLPEEVGLFKNLYELKLAGCDLTKLPNSIGSLKKLRRLDLAGNPLKDLPKAITDCPRLQVINLLGNKLSYSTLFDIANDFFLKGNVWGAVQVGTYAIDNPEESWLTSPYTQIVKLLKNIVEKNFSTDGDYEYLSEHIVAAIEKIPDKYNAFESFIEILQGIGNVRKICDVENPRLEEILEFQTKIADKCIEIANLFPRHLGMHSALCQIAEFLLSGDCYSKGFDVAQQAIELSRILPNYNFLTMVNDTKGSELEHISNILEESSERLMRKDMIDLAIKAAKLIPIERRQSIALSNIEKTL